MNKVRKLPLTVAALLGLGAAPGTQAVNLSTDGLGEVLLVPYYTSRAVPNTENHWTTLVNLTNTSDKAVVVKVRLRRATDSGEVLDFLVALSSHDVFTFVVEDDGSGNPRVRITDPDTCRVPNSNSYPISDSSGDEGYIEILELGYAENNALAGAINGHQCNQVGSYFTHNIDAAAQQLGEPINVLKANWRLLNGALGMEGGDEAVAWANFYNPLGGADGEVEPSDNEGCSLNLGDVGWMPDGSGGSCMNLAAAQLPATEHLPNLDNAYPVQANWWDDRLNVPLMMIPESGEGYDAVNLTILRSAAINEWVGLQNSTWTVDTEWIVTFPTKHFGQSGCYQVAFELYDRAQNPATFTSPSKPPELCNEVNVLRFNHFGILGSSVQQDIDLDGLVERGWMRLHLDSDPNAYLASRPRGIARLVRKWFGLPVVGVAVKQRVVANDVTKNYISIVPHAYERRFEDIREDAPVDP